MICAYTYCSAVFSKTGNYIYCSYKCSARSAYMLSINRRKKESDRELEVLKDKYRVKRIYPTGKHKLIMEILPYKYVEPEFKEITVMSKIE